MIQGEWKDCTIDITTSDTLSSECDLGRAYETLLIVIPTITAASISVKAAEKAGGTYQDLYITSTNDATEKKPLSTSGTGGITWAVPIGGFQFIKLLSSNAQADDRAFRVCGIRS